jgi:cell division protein FtsZ
MTMPEPVILDQLPPWSPPTVAVLGLGQAGIRSLNALLRAPVRGINGIAVAGDAAVLATSLAPVTLPLDSTWHPEHNAALHDILADTALVFLIGSMGEPYSRAMMPWIARRAQDNDCLTIALVSTCAPGDATRDMRQVEADLHTLRSTVDALIPLSVQRVWQVTERLPTWHDTIGAIDTAVRLTIQGIADLVTQTGLVCLDLMDLRMLFRDSGGAMMGGGMASGAEAVVVAAQQALASPWLDIATLPQARSVVVNITGGTALSLTAVHEAARTIFDQAQPDAGLIFGAIVDEQMQDEARVTMVAAGLPTLMLNQSTGDSYTRRRRHVDTTRSHVPLSVPMSCGSI